MKEFIINLNKKRFEVRLEKRGDKYLVFVDDSPFEVEIFEKSSSKTKASSLVKPLIKSAEEEILEKKAIVAPMPGKITSIHVKVGDHIPIGELLLKLEAMKMENEIRAFASGKVEEIRVKVGDSVNQGDVLLTVG
ncbi:MAG: biotin/lipoyl-containing protein [Candidatus Methanofastidiosia archaeon]